MWVDRIALTFTSPSDHTTCGSSRRLEGDQVGQFRRSAKPQAADHTPSTNVIHRTATPGDLANWQTQRIGGCQLSECITFNPGI